MKILNTNQNTEEWLEQRKGKITGSKLKDIVVKKGTNKKIGFYQLMADKLALDEIVEDAMERGHQLEDEAIKLFEKQSKLKVEQTGLCLSDEDENIAISPDGWVKKGKKYINGVEIKCLAPAKHLQAYFEQEIPSEYREQAMQYFIVNKDCEKLYFVFYDPRITAKPLHWIEINREDVEDEIQYLKDYQIQTLAEIEELLTKLSF